MNWFEIELVSLKKKKRKREVRKRTENIEKEKQRKLTKVYLSVNFLATEIKT